MIIIVGHSRAKDVIERDAAVAAFAKMVEKARNQPGCIEFSITADSVDPERTNLLECWEDQQALDAWRKVARGPRVATKPEQVWLYHSDKAEKLF